ncbi:hypothetical protein SDC9_02383 [bioreactor metagenome]|jgi:hypothetical protein|uniref:Uncharacterized protein n=1 Tax=bioreactor metagenome TaxID=1076179 RepID=A0A644ST88_9ZZZZ
MTKQIAYFLIFASVLLLGIDFYDSGFNFEKSRIFRNISSIMLIILGVSSLVNLKNKNKS